MPCSGWGEVEHVAVDKTGTLTLGALTVTAADDDVLQVAAGLERTSHHPIARAICREAVQRALPLPLPSAVEEIAGQGISGTWQGQRWTLRSGGAGVVELSADGVSAGRIELGDALRSDANRAVQQLQDRGLRVTLLSGDTEEAAQRVATQLGIQDAAGGLLPDDKAAWIDDHPNTLFVGDGLNDGPALRSAHVGVVLHSGASAALGVADGVLAAAELDPLVVGLEAAAATQRTVRMNLRRSLIYNAVAVTAAAAGWVNPLVAAVLMPLSSAVVLWGSRAVEAHLRSLEA